MQQTERGLISYKRA